MKNISDKTKKRLIVTGSLAVCAVLIVLIGSHFMTELQVDEAVPSQSAQSSDITVESTTEEEKDVVVTVPDVSESAGADSTAATDSIADSTGTEQALQEDVTKPEYTEEQITDPSQKPNGESATTTPKSTDSSAQQTTGTSSGSSSSSGGLPGFDSVPDGGANQIIDGESTGDINKQVGDMN